MNGSLLSLAPQPHTPSSVRLQPDWERHTGGVSSEYVFCVLCVLGVSWVPFPTSGKSVGLAMANLIEGVAPA